MPIPPVGPIYCETPTLFTGFPAEPVNTWTNLLAIALAVVAMVLVYRYAPRAWGLWIYALLLLAVGIGSTLWHGLRSEWALLLDVTPGLLVLFTLVLLWAREVFGARYGVAFFGAVAAILVGTFWFLAPASFNAAFAIMILVLLCGGLWLVYQTHQRDSTAMRLGLLTLALGLLAAGARMADSSLCELIPFGIHFLWHFLISSAAFVGFLMVLRLQTINKQQQLEHV